MTRIAVGAFLHETNTFAPTKATYDDFVHGGGWPSMAHGADVLKVIGKALPLVVSLDLHANVSPEMMEHADALIAYRTYPHVDMADTGRACARHLALMLKTKARFAKAFRQLPFLIPISWQCTNDQPTKGIYQKLSALQSDAVLTLSFAPGFPAAGVMDC